MAGLSLVVVRPAPSYDPWAWLLWGRELLGGGLSTDGGPAFKPLPVAVSALLGLLGTAAPWAWVVVARAAAVLAAALAWRLGRRLAGGSVWAGAAAAGSLVLCGRYLGYAASGSSEGLVVALALGAVEAGRAHRPRLALACAVGCGLLRVETWPFLVVAGLLAWRRRPQDRALLLLVALAVPAAWLVPEMVGSGDPLRSAARAQVPNPGQPALAAAPAVASLRAALALPLWPLWAGVVALAWTAARHRQRTALAALVPFAAGSAWIALVAAMAEAGFSGEGRYALPGAALMAVSGAVGLLAAPVRGQRPRAWTAVAVGLLVLSAGPRVVDLADLRASQAYQWTLQSDLSRAVESVGGAEAVLACGRPHVGRLRGPLLAYHLDVRKSAVDADGPPRSPGMIFRSPLAPGAAPAPAVPTGFEPRATAGTWTVYASC